MGPECAVSPKSKNPSRKSLPWPHHPWLAGGPGLAHGIPLEIMEIHGNLLEMISTKNVANTIVINGNQMELLVFNVSFDFSLSCALFAAWDPSYREGLSKNSYIPQRFHTRTFLCFDSVSTHPSDEEDLSKTFMSARLTQRQFHCLFPFPLWLPSVFDFRWTLIFR
jgi:hypothetical protein